LNYGIDYGRVGLVGHLGLLSEEFAVLKKENRFGPPKQAGLFLFWPSAPGAELRALRCGLKQKQLNLPNRRHRPAPI
jgi:hypothetical protein